MQKTPAAGHNLVVADCHIPEVGIRRKRGFDRDAARSVFGYSLAVNWTEAGIEGDRTVVVHHSYLEEFLVAVVAVARKEVAKIEKEDKDSLAADHTEVAVHMGVAAAHMGVAAAHMGVAAAHMVVAAAHMAAAVRMTAVVRGVVAVLNILRHWVRKTRYPFSPRLFCHRIDQYSPEATWCTKEVLSI